MKKNFRIRNEKLHVGEAILEVGASIFYRKNPTRTWKIEKIFQDNPPSIDIVQEESGCIRNTTLENIEVFGGMPKRSFSYFVTNKSLLRIGEIVLSPGTKVFYNKEPGRIWIIDKFNFGEDPPSVDIFPAEVSPNDNVVPRNTVLDNIEPYDQQWPTQRNSESACGASMYPPSHSYPTKNPIPLRSEENGPSNCYFPSYQTMERNNPRESHFNIPNPTCSAPSPQPQPASDEEKESIPSWRTEGSSVFIGDSELRVGTPVIYKKSPHLKWFIVKVYALDNPPTFDINEFESNREVNTTLAMIKPLCIPKKATTTTPDSNEDAELCILCVDKESTHALIPCGHKSYCPECAHKLETCALCRQTVTGHLRVFE